MAKITKTYIGTKVIRAVPMNEADYTEMPPDESSRPGYKVTYPDGYESWSPKDAFENTYREVTYEEKAFFLS